MSIFSYFNKKPQPEERSCQPGIDFSFLNQSSASITEGNVYQLSIVKACVEYIADEFAVLSHNVYQKTDTGRVKVSDHRVQQMLLNPNELQTGFTFKQTMQSFPLVNGNAYAWIDGTSLYILPPNQTQPVLKNGYLTYETTVNQKKMVLDAYQVIHIPGLGNGIKGMSPIQQAKKTLDLAANHLEFGKSFFENGSQLGGFLKSPRRYKPEEAQNLLGSFAAGHQGARKAFKVGLLEEGMDYVAAGVPPEQAQFLESRKFSDKQIATQLFKIPAHMLDLEPTSANLEQRTIQFYQFCLMPWVKRWEQEINRKLFTEKEKKQGFYFEFNLDTIHRADAVTRTNIMNSRIQNGWANKDEARELENLDHLPDGQGQIFITPLNMVSTDQIKDQPSQEAPAEEGNPNTLQKARSNAEALTKLVEDGARRVLTREAQKVKNAVKHNLRDASNPEAFRSFIDGFYQEYEATIRQTMQPILETTGGNLDKFVADHVEESRKQIALAMWSSNPADQIDEVVGKWAELRSKQIAEQTLEEDE